jgi:hypothetical protein
MPTFAAAEAVKALYNSKDKSVDFTVKLANAGKIDAATKAVTFFVKVAEEFFEAELTAAEIQALITAVDQEAIVFKMFVTLTPPAVIVYYVIHQTNSGADSILTMDSSNTGGLLKITAKPGPLTTPEISHKLIVAGALANSVNVSGEFRFHLPASNGGDDFKSYNRFLTIGDVVTPTFDITISADDIARGYMIYSLVANNVTDGKKITMAYSVDNASGDQSRLSHPFVILASIKPEKPSFTAESGKMDEAAVYIPLKIKYDLASDVWNRVNIMTKSGTTLALAAYFARTLDTDKEMEMNGFVEYKLLVSAPGTPLVAFAKYELVVVLSKDDYSDYIVADKSTQSKPSESKIVVAGIKKFEITHTTTSTYTAQSAFGSPAKHTFTKGLTFTAPGFQVGLSAKLLQNGVEVDAKDVLIGATATNVNIIFDRDASLVQLGDEFVIVTLVKVAIDDAKAEYLSPNATFGDKAALLIVRDFRSKSVVAQPQENDLPTAMKVRAVSDILVSNKTQLLLEFELLKSAEEKPYKFSGFDVQVSEDNFDSFAELSAGGAETMNVPIDVSDDKKLDEVLFVQKFVGGVGSTFSAKKLLYIRFRSKHNWVGGDASVVNRPWIVYQYITKEEAKPAAPAAHSISQEKVNKLKVSFVKAAAVDWAGASTNGVSSKFEPVTHKFILINEIGNIIKTHNVNHDESIFTNLETRIDIEDSELNQFVRVKHVVQYLNNNNVSIESDATFCPELFLAKKLNIRSIQVVETALKIKLLVDIDFGRLLNTAIDCKAVMPFKSGVTDTWVTGALSYDSVEKMFFIEHDKQDDSQGSKYGRALKIFVFATGLNGQMATATYPMIPQ